MFDEKPTFVPLASSSGVILYNTYVAVRSVLYSITYGPNDTVILHFVTVSRIIINLMVVFYNDSLSFKATGRFSVFHRNGRPQSHSMKSADNNTSVHKINT